MIETEIVHVITKLLPDGCGLELRCPPYSVGDPELIVFCHTFDHVKTQYAYWYDVRTFLFGNGCVYDSFFSWLKYWERIRDKQSQPYATSRGITLVNIIDKILTAHPWLTSLEKCSSVEELEMMLAINGVMVG